MSTKLPGIPALPKNLPPDVAAYLSALTQVIQVRLGRIGDPLDRAVTLRELIDSGLAEALKAAPFDPNNIGGGNIGFVSPTDITDLSIPPAPTTLSATPGFKSVILSWTNGNTQFGNFSFSEIFRHTSDVIGDAVRVAVVSGNRVTDQVDTNTTYYYWVRHVSTSDVVGPFNQTAGTAATTLDIQSADIASNAVTETKIADDSISTPKIQANSITAASGILANAAVLNATIADATIENAKIASLDASKINTGQLSANRINVDGATITASGSGALQVNTLSANKITTGTLNASLVTVTNLNASNINTGTMSADRIDVNNLILPTGGGVVSGSTIGAYPFGTGGTASTNHVTSIGSGVGVYFGYVRLVGGTDHLKNVFLIFTTSSGTVTTSNTLFKSAKTDKLEGGILRFYSSTESTNIPILFQNSSHTGSVHLHIQATPDSPPDTFGTVEAMFLRLGIAS